MSNKNSQTGFTLIELLIVVLIIGILAAIAIPVFNGQRTKAKNSVAQSTVRNAFTAASSYLTNGESYTGVTPALLSGEESSLSAGDTSKITAGTSAEDKKIFTYAAGSTTAASTTTVNAATTTDGIIICAVSKGDTVYCVKQVVANGSPSSPTYYAQKTNGSNNATAFKAIDVLRTTTTGVAAPGANNWNSPQNAA